METIIKKNPVIAILRNIPSNLLSEYMQSLYTGGLRAFEVSFTTKDAASQIAWIKEHMPKDVCIGAGTVLSVADAETAIKAGSDFLLSPASTPQVLDYCREHQIRFLPGVFSPTDIALCLSYGFHVLKCFPAGELPKHYCKSIKGPFPSAKLVAVGGISPDNTAEFLKAGYAGVGIGSSLIDETLFEEKNWTQISCNIHQFLTSLKNHNSK